MKRGDTLYSIARANGVSVNALMSVNGIKDAGSLQIGRKLVMPGATKTAQVSLRASRPAPSARKLTVVIDPGHGGRDRGAVWGGVRECDLNLKTALKLESYLKKAGYQVVLTRRSDSYVSLARRAATANRYRQAIFISIHYNASRLTGVHGGETFHGGSASSRYLASSLQGQLVSRCKVRNRGARYGRFSVLSETRCPAVLIECGFISNARERARCQTSAFQDAAAQAILAGIQRWDRAY
ncbi:N-acetylmuramoyl-L-alanine amidase [Roseibacillus ishigakijimensis]|uniref:N-acetylmuramoyl-L-alanine amidase n=1 Tax=Roseibacillus ishigakijimensis TaxID=454146 RepID=UPI001907E189|nr:N-acetylmuramoyl-L-alanine amidase [Roseibacillus ishigakijimensis]